MPFPTFLDAGPQNDRLRRKMNSIRLKSTSDQRLSSFGEVSEASESLAVGRHEASRLTIQLNGADVAVVTLLFDNTRDALDEVTNTTPWIAAVEMAKSSRRVALRRMEFGDRILDQARGWIASNLERMLPATRRPFPDDEHVTVVVGQAHEPGETFLVKKFALDPTGDVDGIQPGDSVEIGELEFKVIGTNTSLVPDHTRYWHRLDVMPTLNWT